MKNFIAVTYLIKNNKIILAATSNGFSVYDANGINLKSLLDFLFSLLQFKKNKDTVFCTYAAGLDNEFLFAALPVEIKDKLFQSVKFKKQLSILQNEQLELQKIFYSHNTSAQEKEETDFNLYVNKLAIADLHEIIVDDYKIKLVNGKYLKLTKNSKSITIYDIYGFFRKPLTDVIRRWHNTAIIKPANGLLSPEQIERTTAILLAKSIAKLGNDLASSLADNGINLAHYFGASCVSSWLLSKSEAKKEFYNYTNLRSLPCELSKAMLQAFQSPRAEQLKLGTVQDVNVFDINSAYAFACLDLPILLRKPIFVKDYTPSDFAIWYVDFDFTDINPYFGLLPTRDKKTNQSGWFLRGKGYYWNCEINYLLKLYPNNITVKYGYVWPKPKRAEFTKAINALYNTRKELDAINHPLSKVIKLALSSIYGKFCQQNGRGYYNNYFYAGYILSKVRTMLLQATQGNEHQTVCFLTDAIHTTADLPVEISNTIGAYKVNKYTVGTYLDTGIYRLIAETGKIKTATKGYRVLDFESILTQITEHQFFEAQQKIFVTHNLHELSPVTFKDYLSVLAFTKKESALADKRFKMREFAERKINFRQDFIDSEVINGSSSAESGVYKISDYKESDILLDALFTNKI